jgi:hypothetical protein
VDEWVDGNTRNGQEENRYESEETNSLAIFHVKNSLDSMYY